MGLACQQFLRAAIEHDWRYQQRRYLCEVDLMGNDADEKRTSPSTGVPPSTNQLSQQRAQIQAQLAAINERVARLTAASKLNPNVHGTIQQLRLQQKALAAQLAQIDAKAASAH